MGIVQKLERLSSCGTVTIDGDRGQWFIVKFLDPDGTEIESQMPTLKQAIESVDRQLSLLVARDTVSNWHNLVDPWSQK